VSLVARARRRRRGGRCAWLVAAGLCALPVDAGAQALVPGRVEAGIGGHWIGAALFGERRATLTTSSGGPFTLFDTENDLTPVAGLEGRAALRIVRALELEASVTYGRADLRTRITSDVEGIPDVTVTAAIRQFSVGGALVAYLSGLAAGSRAIPFVTGGVSHLRHLHEGRTLVETGRLYHVGGGVSLLLVSRAGAPRLKAAGIRADVRAVLRTGGVAPDQDVRTAPAAGASLFVRF
jgi:hypothetical protein